MSFISENSSLLKKIGQFLLAWTLVTLPFDQLTKSMSRQLYLVHEDDGDTTIYQGKRQEIFSIGGDSGWVTCNLTYVRNHGASWGVMKDLPDAFRPPILVAVGLTFSLLLLAAAVQFMKTGETALAQSLVLMVVGSFGNLIDRLRLGYVVDFMTLRGSVGGQAWALPSFNVADMIIVVGLFCVITMLLRKNKIVAH